MFPHDKARITMSEKRKKIFSGTVTKINLKIEKYSYSVTFLVLVCCLAELEDDLGVGVADDFGVGVLEVLVGVVRDEIVLVVDFLVL